MKKHTLIIGTSALRNITKAAEISAPVGNEARNVTWYNDRDKYIAFKFPEGTDFLIFHALDVIDNKYDLNFIDKLSQYEDAVIKTTAGVKKVPMPQIIVTATGNINDPLPEIFNNSERWIVLTCNS